MSYKHWFVASAMWVGLAVVAWAQPPYKALLVDGQNVSSHPWKETSPVLKKLLVETGLFTVETATSPAKGQDMSGFKPSFAGHQVVVLNYQGDDWPAETQKAFVDYVKGGGGVVVFHFACAAFPQWKEYNEIIGLGGWFRDAKTGTAVHWRDGKIVYDDTPGEKCGGHGPSQTFQLVIRDANHPITKGLPEKFMHGPDELYGWLRGPAKNLTVLATAFAPKDDGKGGKGGSDEHEPLLFTVAYGQGRVVQNAMGHTAKELKSVAFIVTFQRCAEWAATGKVTQKVPADFPGPDKTSVRE